MGIAGKPVQVRNHGATEVKTANGSFMSSSLPVAGFAVIEAPTLAEAISMVAKTPCAVAHGVVEVWPLDGCVHSKAILKEIIDVKFPQRLWPRIPSPVE